MNKRQLSDPMAAGTEGNYAEPGVNIASALWRRKWLLILTLAVGCAAGYYHHTRQEPRFRSVASVLLEPKVGPALQGVVGIQQTTPTNLGGESALMRSPAVVMDAVKEKGLASLPSLAGVADPVGAIVSGLSSRYLGKDSHMFELSYVGGTREDCPVILAAVIDSYKSFLGDRQESVSDESIRLIQDAKDKLLKQLNEKETEYREFREKAPLLWSSGGSENIHKTRLESIEDARAELLIRDTQLRAELSALEDASRHKDKRAALSLVVDKLRAAQAPVDPEHATNTQLTSSLLPLLIEQRDLEETYGEKHPKLKSLRRRIELISQHLGQDAVGIRSAASVDLIALYLESVRQELETNRQKIAQLSELFDEEKKEAKELMSVEVQDQSYRNEIARVNQLFESVVKRLDEMKLLENSGGLKMRTISPAAPAVQFEPNLGKSLSYGALLGVLAGAVLAYLLERADKNFESPEQIQQELGANVLGHIPVLPVRPPKNLPLPVDYTVTLFHQPLSPVSESYRAVRTSLLFQANCESLKVLQVTSPDAGDGKSTTAVNLAAAFAQTGKRVLLVDCDLRRSRVHELLHLDNSVGVTTILTADAELDDAIVDSSIPNLSVLPAGPRPRNPAELLVLPRFRQLLATLEQKFDYVIIDSPPVLAVTDASVIAAQVDGIVVTLKLSESVRPKARLAIESLRTVGGQIAGVVVNGVGRDGTRYAASYRGRQNYGGAYYGYGYGYGVEDEAEETKAPARLTSSLN